MIFFVCSVLNLPMISMRWWRWYFSMWCFKYRYVHGLRMDDIGHSWICLVQLIVWLLLLNMDICKSYWFLNSTIYIAYWFLSLMPCQLAITSEILSSHFNRAVKVFSLSYSGSAPKKFINFSIRVCWCASVQSYSKLCSTYISLTVCPLNCNTHRYNS